MNDKQYTQEMIKNLNTRLKTKQEALKFDNTPTEGSVNPVTSEGVKAYIDSSKGTTYIAGKNITISEDHVISAVDTKYSAGQNVEIYDYGNSFGISSRIRDVNATEEDDYLKTLLIKGDRKNILLGCKVREKFSNLWVQKVWNSYTNISGEYIWTDGNNIYYSFDTNQYILDKETSTWVPKVWNGLSTGTRLDGQYIWTDGDNIYYSTGSTHYILDKSTSTWSTKTWSGLTDFYG